MQLMLDDYVQMKPDVILTTYLDAYRALNRMSGVLMKLNATSTLILSIIEEKHTLEQLMKELVMLLGDNCTTQEEVVKLLMDLYCKGFVDIEKNMNKPTILLINPCSSSKIDYHTKRNISPPLGLILIGTMLSVHDYNVVIIDMEIENLEVKDIMHRISDIKFDYVGISMNFTVSTKNSLKICALIKEEYEGIPIIVGGNHATFTFEDLILDQNIDFIIRYNGHETFVELIGILEQKSDQSEKLLGCKGIAFINEKTLITTEEREKIYDLDAIPLFDWNLIKYQLYSENQRWSLFTSVGCTNSCHFCSTSAFNGGRGIGRMSYPRIIEHIENIFKYENNDFIKLIFVDDAFTADKKRIIGLCNEIINKKIKVMWGCNARADQVNGELLRLMKKANCTNMFFGIESCDEDVLLSSNKKLKLDLKGKFSEIKSYGISLTLSFIIGLPKETKRSLQKTMDFLKDVNPEYAIFSFLVLYPGTEYYKNKEKYGIRQIVDKWELYESYRPYIETSDLSANDQINALIMLTESIYKY